MLIGDKTVFAIEYDVKQTSPALLGNIRTWICNFAIGSYQEQVPLLGSLASFELLAAEDRRTSIPAITNSTLDPHQQIESLVYDEFNHDRLMFNVDESTDDYHIFVFMVDGKVCFLWELREDTFYAYPERDKGAHYCEVQFSAVKDVVDSFKRNLSRHSARGQ